MAGVRTDELDYDLAAERIATTPATPRDAARLMVVRRQADCSVRIDHGRVHDLPELGVLSPGDLMVVNDSRVIPAQLEARRQNTGGRITGLYLAEPEPGLWQVMLESRGKLKPGETISLMSHPSASEVNADDSPRPVRGESAGEADESEHAQLILETNLSGGYWQGRLQSRLATLDLLERIGRPPLPPYIRRARRQRDQPTTQPEDPGRYQTVYADEPGSSAAPTAGLHFTPALLDRLEAQGIERAGLTLHVGPGTFAPVRTGRLEDHPIHSERISVPRSTVAAIGRTRQRGGRILMVGTTSVRAIESLAVDAQAFVHEIDAKTSASSKSRNLAESYTQSTDLFITPERVEQGQFSWRYTDMLLTNFHLPRSTLLAMVAALPGIGIEQLLECYRQAMDAGYRFYSYGDAMLIV